MYVKHVAHCVRVECPIKGSWSCLYDYQVGWPGKLGDGCMENMGLFFPTFMAMAVISVPGPVWVSVAGIRRGRKRAGGWLEAEGL